MIISSFKKYNFAFTLAEVLITLGIIGIVAALTIPTLMQNFQENAWKQAWKKQYAVFSQAYQQIKRDEGGTLEAYFDGTTFGITNNLIKKFPDYLSVIKKCTDFHSNVCGITPAVNLENNDVYKTLSNSYIIYSNFIYHQFILKDGTQVYSRGYDPNYAVIWVDVNGYSKKPNTLGKDLFCMVLTKEKIMPCGAVDAGLGNSCNETPNPCPGARGFHPGGDCAGAGCSAEYLYK